MSRLVWHKGMPDKLGMYWYDGSVFRGRPLVLQIRPGTEGDYGWCYGPGGSGPLECYYHKSMAKTVRHAQIPETKKWIEASAIKGNNNYCWFEDTKGHYGFGIIDAGWGGKHYVTGTWIWVNHPSCAADHGGDVQWTDGWKFSLVKVPEI